MLPKLLRICIFTFISFSSSSFVFKHTTFIYILLFFLFLFLVCVIFIRTFLHILFIQLYSLMLLDCFPNLMYIIFNQASICRSCTMFRSVFCFLVNLFTYNCGNLLFIFMISFSLSHSCWNILLKNIKQHVWDMYK